VSSLVVSSRLLGALGTVPRCIWFNTRFVRSQYSGAYRIKPTPFHPSGSDSAYLAESSSSRIGDGQRRPQFWRPVFSHVVSEIESGEFLIWKTIAYSAGKEKSCQSHDHIRRLIKKFQKNLPETIVNMLSTLKVAKK
jgi:hypothetical protein